MKKMTKILSIFLVLVMVVGLFSTTAVAATPDISLKYTVEAMNPADVSGAEGVYKLTLSVKTTPTASMITNIIRIQYDKTLFSPVCTSNGSLPTSSTAWRQTAAVSRQKAAITYLGDLADIDTFYSETGVAVSEEDAYYTSQGYAVKNSNNWSSVVRNVPAAAIGTLDSAKYGAIIITQDIGDSAIGLYAPDGYEDFMSVYFYAKDVAADVTGAEFGYIIDGETAGAAPEFAADADGKLGYMVGDNTGKFVALSYEVINAVIAAPVPAGPTITKLGSQIRFNSLETAEGGVGSADFDIRTRAKVSKTDMMTLLSTDEAGLQAALKAADIRMGFVYQATVNGPFIADDAKAAAIAGKDQGTYYVKDVKYAAFEGDDILWTCLIDDAKYDGEVIALPYIILGEEAYFLDGTITCNFSDGYDAKYADYAATQS